MKPTPKPRLKLLCLGTYPVESAATRYRVLQFFPDLSAAGIDASYRPFMDSRFFESFYKPGRSLHKSMRLLGSALRRLNDVQRAGRCDVVLIHREAALFGPPLIEALIARVLKKPVVFDFDDAIHLPSPGSVHGRLATALKYPQKTPKTIRMSRAVVVGNRHLEEYARALNPHVTLIPTVVDARVVQPARERTGEPGDSGATGRVHRDRKTVLGWIGTHSTYPYLEALFPVLRRIAHSHSIVLRVVGAGREIAIPGVEVDNRTWSLKSELGDLQSFDIGLYPILEDQWSLGKSGFKAIQYMAVGIPAVCSPVGATCDIVHDGVHGFLPSNADEWTERLLHLIEDAALRERLGQAGRARVEEWYCLQRQAPRLQAVIEAADVL